MEPSLIITLAWSFRLADAGSVYPCPRGTKGRETKMTQAIYRA